MPRFERLLLCSCEGSMEVDPTTASAALDGIDVLQATRLCTGDLDVATKALTQDGTTLIACGQMTTLFAELADELDAVNRFATTDIRDRAGWTTDTNAFAKQAALLAEAALPLAETPTKDVNSEGTVLILGAPEFAIPAADKLADRLAVTCLLTTEPEDIAPPLGYDTALGQLKSASGALGGFKIEVDGFAQMRPGGRGSAIFGDPVNGAKSNCDVILDLRGDGPLFPADHKREGYVRADPGNPLAIERAVDEAHQLQGVFEKPLYIRFDASLCAHSRANQPGCDRCLTVCPTGAILPDGDTVAIYPDICAGCGACASVCPSGAASYDDPPVGTLFARLRTLATEFRKAGGTNPRVLFHGADWGAEMIRLSARFGRGLPADVIPVEVSSVDGTGHAELLAALGVGFATATVMPDPRDDFAVIESQLALAAAIAGDAALTLLDVSDPDAMETALFDVTPQTSNHNPILPLGGRREVTRLSATALSPPGLPIPLPSDAPYGAVNINADACTLCLACVSLCPTGALADNPDRPEVRFQETACLQCGICANTCPESAITLTPRLDLSTEALSHRTLHGEDPFDCIDCGKPFGVKSTIERIVEKLEDKHWMFKGSDNVKLIQMCDDCRVSAQFHQEGSPLRGGERPKVRTTEDYMKDRKPN